MGKFCSNCGAKINESEKFCHSCRAEQKKEAGSASNAQHNAQSNQKNIQDYFSEAYLRETFLSMEGRLGRFSYFKWLLILDVASILLCVIVESLLLKEWETTNTPCSIIELMINLSILYPTYCLTVRRIKDMDKSLSIANWYVLIGGIYTIGLNINDYFAFSLDGKVLGFVFLIYSLYLIFTPGTSGENQHGEEPM